MHGSWSDSLTESSASVGSKSQVGPDEWITVAIEPAPLELRLRRAFGGTRGESRVVVRQAVDLADSGQYERDVGVSLTNDVVIDELSEPAHGTPADRWNWWIGALEVAYGGYRHFGIQRHR